MRTALLIAALAAPSPPAAAQESAGPAFEWIGPHEHKFGEVVAGELLEHTFQFMSTGDEDLVVELLKVSCDCTTLEATRIASDGARTPYEVGTPLAPGEILELWESVDTTGKRGKLAYTTRVLMNTERGFAVAALRMEAVGPIVVDPTYVDVGETWPNDEKRAEYVLTNVWQEPFRVEPLRHRDEFHTPTTLEPVDPDARGWARSWRVTVDVRGSQPGRKKGWVPIPMLARLEDKPRFASADAEGRATAEFELGLVVDKIDVVRSRPLRLPVVAPAAGATRSSSFAVETPVDWDLEALTAGDVELFEGADAPWAEAISFEVRRPEGLPWEVEVTVGRPLGPDEPPLEGAIRVRIDHPKQDWLYVPFGAPMPRN